MELSQIESTSFPAQINSRIHRGIESKIDAMRVPVQEAKQVGEIATGLSSGQLDRARAAIDVKVGHLDRLKVVGLVADIAIGVACGAGSVVFGRDVMRHAKAIENTKIGRIAWLAKRHRPQFEQKLQAAKRNTLVLGGLAGGILALRPVSRAIFMLAPSHPEPMRIGEIIHAMKLRRQTRAA